MSRRARVPSYRLHKQSGQAVVTLPDGLGGRRDVLLGKYDTPESRAEYLRVLAEWEANGRRLPQPLTGPAGLTLNELLLAYWRFVEQYYRHPWGEPTSEADNIRLALRPLRQLYGHTLAADFGSLSLEALREEMIRQGRCRNRVNKDVARIKRMFRWGAAKNLVPLNVFQSLQAVEGLRTGRSAARETAPVKPVDDAVVEVTLPYLTPQLAAMVQLQRHTGMRPGEVIVMRGIDLDMTGRVWLYRPGSDRGPNGAHKTAWRGQQRVVALGPKAQEVLRPWLRLNLTEYLFQPREAMAAYRAERRRKRKTKVPPGQQQPRKARPRKAPRERYTNATYAQAISKGVLAANRAAACEVCKKLRPADRCEACKAAALPHWHPNQLRHTAATKIRREYGLDTARVVLGHRSPQVTELYAELDVGKAVEVMGKLG
jgi:integrase